MRPADLSRLQGIVATLRGPDGCPWDRRQTLATLEHTLLEECYEVVDALRSGDAQAHREELGDLLFQIVLQAQLQDEAGAFGLADVAGDIADKLIRRHPHVFGDETAADAAQVAARWDELKQAEGKGGVDAIPRALPALMRAEAVGKRAAKRGFDWPDIDGPLAKVDEELAELRAALATGEGIEEELGDLLFAVVNVARHAGTAEGPIRPERGLDRTTDRFLARFAHVQSALSKAALTLASADEATLDAMWADAKAAVG